MRGISAEKSVVKVNDNHLEDTKKYQWQILNIFVINIDI